VKCNCDAYPFEHYKYPDDGLCDSVGECLHEEDCKCVEVRR
jgi:hypothetical protein